MGVSNMRDHRLTVSALIIAGLASSIGGMSLAADPPKSANKPAKAEQIPGSDLMRVVLTPKAAERLAIETAPVREEPVRRWLTVNADVEAMPEQPAMVAAATASTGSATASDVIPVRLSVPLLTDPNARIGQAFPTLSVKDDDDDDDDKVKRSAKDGDKGAPPAILIMPINGGDASKRLRAQLIEVGAASAAGGTSYAYYTVTADTQKSGLRPGQRVRVRVPQPGSGTPQKVIPHSAVVYDARGKAWTYTNPEPLVFVRHAIGIEGIQGDIAVLSDGPAVGTKVVTAGAPELMGVELKFGN
jgi:hypothetical protein